MWICRRIDSSSIIAHPIYTTGTIAKIRCQEVDISIIDRYNIFDNRYGFFVSNGNTNWTCFRYQKLTNCVSRPAFTCRSGGRHLGIFARGSNLALVFEAVQSRPMTTFSKSWHNFPEQYFGSFGQWICLPGSQKWKYRQNYNVNKWQVLIREQSPWKSPVRGPQRAKPGFYTKSCPLVKSNLICPSDKLSWQPGCPVLNINIQGNFCISQGNGSSDNLPENLV